MIIPFNKTKKLKERTLSMKYKTAICFLMLVIAFFSSGCGRVVEDGQASLYHTFGKIDDHAGGSGFKFFVPVLQRVEKWNVKKQEIKEVAAVPSSEGLISTLEVSIIFRYPFDKVSEIRKTIGNEDAVKNAILIPYTREAIRAVASGYPVKSLYSDAGRSEIASHIYNKLSTQLAKSNITIEDVLLRDVKLPEAFSASITNKLKVEQEALQKQFELDKAKKDAEIEVAKADGVAKANEIIASSITENYLRYKFIESLSDGKSEVIYIPTEAGLPILEASRKPGN